jgi:hypothetical protein
MSITFAGTAIPIMRYRLLTKEQPGATARPVASSRPPGNAPAPPSPPMPLRRVGRRAGESDRVSHDGNCRLGCLVGPGLELRELIDRHRPSFANQGLDGLLVQTVPHGVERRLFALRVGSLSGHAGLREEFDSGAEEACRLLGLALFRGGPSDFQRRGRDHVSVLVVERDAQGCETEVSAVSIPSLEVCDMG